MEDREDDTCCVCENGGKLTCCDVCPRVYHLRCLPYQDITLLRDQSFTEDWWCPRCRRLARLSFSIYHILTYASADSGGYSHRFGADRLFEFFSSEQHDGMWDALREVSAGSFSELTLSLEQGWEVSHVGAIEFETAIQATRELRPHVGPQAWMGCCDDPDTEDDEHGNFCET